jgi:hypothetical protein
MNTKTVPFQAGNNGMVKIMYWCLFISAEAAQEPCPALCSIPNDVEKFTRSIAGFSLCKMAIFSFHIS